jgi:glycerol-3-phosphate dehydrogenase
MYGSRFDAVLDLVAQRGTGGRLHPDLPWLGVQVDFAVEHEWARTVEDVLRRRLPIALGPHRRDASITRKVAERMGALLGWDAEAREDSVTLGRAVTASRRPSGRGGPGRGVI